MRVLLISAAMVSAGTLVGCINAFSEDAADSRFVPFQNKLGDKISGDVVIAGPLRKPIADLSGEPRDVVLLQTSSKRALVLLNNGSGGLKLGEEGSFDLGAEPIAAVAADFDDDGAADIAIACRNPNKVRFLMNKGTGEFTLGTDRDVDLAGAPVGMVAQQFNDIGYDPTEDVPSGLGMDVAVAINITGEGGALVVLHRNDDNTRHEVAQTVVTDRGGTDLDTIDDIDSGDLDNDKDIDIVIAAGSKVAPSVRILLNSGEHDGWTLKEEQRLEASDSVGRLTIRRVRCVDLYGDANRDLLITGERAVLGGAAMSTVVSANGGGVGSEWQKFKTAEIRSELVGAEGVPGRIFPGDANRYLDIIAAHPAGLGKLVAYKNDSASVSGPPALKLSRKLEVSPAAGKGLRVVELDGSEGPELLVTNGYYAH